MSVLVFDSNGELWYTRAKELGLDYISMPYFLDGKEYFYDLGEKTDFKEFYAKVRSGMIPKTQALNPEDYKAFLTPYFERGEDVLYISFSHAMSGTFNMLDVALKELKEIYPERTCTVFDTKAISLPAGMQVEQAALLKQKGATDEEILSFLKNFTNKVAVYFTVDDLMHLKRGGRCSGLSAIAGTLLNLKPLLTFNAEGSLCVISKLGGRKKAISTLANKVIEGLDDEGVPVYVFHADCDEDADRLCDLILAKRPNANVIKQMIGPVIGAHCGPGTLAVTFAAAQRPIPLK